ncbi:MAG: hypothetical protein AAB628_02420 [Patescibacteria group bacterium]
MGAIYIDDQHYRDQTSNEDAPQYRMYESSRVKRTAVGKDVFVTKNLVRKNNCIKVNRYSDIQKNITVEMRNVQVKGLLNILPPTYPIVGVCKFKKV